MGKDQIEESISPPTWFWGAASSGQKLCVLPGAESVYEKFIRGWIQRRIHSLPDSTKFAQLA